VVFKIIWEEGFLSFQYLPLKDINLWEMEIVCGSVAFTVCFSHKIFVFCGSLFLSSSFFDMSYHDMDLVDPAGRSETEMTRTTAKAGEFFEWPDQMPEKDWSDAYREGVYDMEKVTSFNLELVEDFVQ
jgi:hypothetical protein